MDVICTYGAYLRIGLVSRDLLEGEATAEAAGVDGGGTGCDEYGEGELHDCYFL